MKIMRIQMIKMMENPLYLQNEEERFLMDRLLHRHIRHMADRIRENIVNILDTRAEIQLITKTAKILFKINKSLKP